VKIVTDASVVGNLHWYKIVPVIVLVLSTSAGDKYRYQAAVGVPV
jgi:hypothetical protein